MARKSRYSDTELAEAVQRSASIAGVLRILDIRPAGGSHFHISKRIKNAGLDTSHFTGQVHNRGKSFPSKRKTPDEILILNSVDEPRIRGHLLRRALAEVGIALACSICGVGATWQNRPLTLHVDHVNGHSHDCRRENLRFLCPNCHSQTSTYCRKTSSRDARDAAA